jgi:hypothetical protein
MRCPAHFEVNFHEKSNVSWTLGHGATYPSLWSLFVKKKVTWMWQSRKGEELVIHELVDFFFIEK